MLNWRKKALKVFNKEKSEKETDYDFARFRHEHTGI